MSTSPSVTRGIIIRKPWITHIYKGEKRWELRGRKTNIRGPVALIEGGSCTITGYATITDCKGPLSRVDRVKAAREGNILACEIDEDMYPDVYAYILSDIVELDTPIPYAHPSGAVIWVTLDPRAQSTLEKARAPQPTRSSRSR